MGPRRAFGLGTVAVLAFVLVFALGASVAFAGTVAPRVAISDSAIANNAHSTTGTYLNPNKGQSIRASMVYDALVASGIPKENITLINDAQLGDMYTLKQYDVLVLPRQIAMTKGQRLVVRQWVAEGGGLVALFGTSRWDYTAGRSPDYQAIVNLKWFGSTWDEFRMWEWGEISEVIQAKFNNDPLMAAGFHVGGADPGSHPILRNTNAQIGRTAPLDLVQVPGDYNELVWMYSGNTNTQVLGTYKSSSVGAGTPAMWTSLFYKGRMFFTGFQLYGMTRLSPTISTAASEYYGTANGQGTKDQARALLYQAVIWAATPGTVSDMSKSPLTGSDYGVNPTPQTVTIRTSATSVVRPKPFVLSGVLLNGVVNDPVVVYVKKPGKAYWSYSSKRLCYSLATGGANWWYRYTPYAKTSPAGTYYFKAAFSGDATRPAGVSRSITVSMR